MISKEEVDMLHFKANINSENACTSQRFPEKPKTHQTIFTEHLETQ